MLVLPHGSHTGTLGLPDGFWLSERFGFPSAYSSPIHVVFLDRVFHSARVGITWHSRAAGFAPPNLGNLYVILSCSIYHTHHVLHTNFHCIPFLSLASRDYTKLEALARRASLRAKSVREQGLCKRERRQDPVGRSSDSLRWSVRSDKDDGRFLMSAFSFHPRFTPIFIVVPLHQFFSYSFHLP